MGYSISFFIPLYELNYYFDHAHFLRTGAYSSAACPYPHSRTWPEGRLHARQGSFATVFELCSLTDRNSSGLVARSFSMRGIERPGAWP